MAGIDTGHIDITAANGAAGDMTATSVTAGGEGNVLLITLDGGSATNDIAVGLITATADDISLVSDAAITDGDAIIDIVSSALYLQSGTAVGTLADYLDTQVTTIDDYSGGNVGTDLYINEDDGVTLGSLNATTGLSTTNGEIRIIGAATVAGTLTASVLTAGGTGKDIYLTTADGGAGSNNIAMGLVTAADDDVWLDSDYDITDADADSTSDVVASGLYLDAVHSVGASGSNAELDTTVDTIDDYSATRNVTVDIYIIETNAVTLGSINGLTTDTGVIDIDAGGTITLNVLTATANAIHLNSTGGNILDNTTGTTMITAASSSSLRAQGYVGIITDPIDVNINSDLWVWAGSQQNQVSAITQGRVASTAKTERTEIFEPSPPGLVIHDNHLMGGGNYGSGSINGSILSRGYGEMQAVRAGMFNLYYGRALEPWGYKISTPWVLSEGTLIDEHLLEGPATIIDGTEVGLTMLPQELRIIPEKFQPNYYIIRSIAR